ncbi:MULTISPECIES: DUF3487 family protein [Vibrio]|uniref:DUF3487 family protein n=1 Tax=Vibrio TaxID=662 RepID=UPI000841F5B3|nr:MULTISPECIES: DUF3487 family protein [Vibrio]ODM56062.1 hypothetical protein BC455_22670 [Vibrio harveyi]USD58521.1 DUF3487 family protein [Vibrio sp. SCSIO 43155]
MSSIEKEKTSKVPLDQLDFSPCSIGGFTNAEFGLCFFGSTVGIALLLVPLVSSIYDGAGIYAAVVSFALALPLTIYLAKRAEILKKGRPSYMLWIDLMRKIQDEGIFGARYNFNLIANQVWDNTKPSNPQKKKSK